MSDESSASYICRDDADQACAATCVSLAACLECQCTFVDTNDGATELPGGEVLAFFLCLMPIVFLVVATLKKNPLKATISLPTAAVMQLYIRTMYLGSDPLLSCGAVMLGMLDALTLLSVMAGAITLLECMEISYCLPYMVREMKVLTSGHLIAEIMLIFNFNYLVEGASGYGTTLAAPMLVSFGYDPLQSVVVLLVFNMAPAIFGGIGTPLWFGLGSFDEAVLEETAQRAAIVLAVSTLIVIPWVLTVIAPREVVFQNLGFIYLSLLSSIGPAVAIAFFSYEFPTLLGGMNGCTVTSILIKYKVLLKPMGSDAAENREWGSLSEHSLVQKYLNSRSNLSNRTESRPRLEVVEGDEEEEQTQSDREIILNSEGTQREGPKSTNHSNAEPDCDVSEAFSEPQQQKAFSEHIDDHLGARKTWAEGYGTDLVLRTFPIWGVVLLLVCTRLPQLGLKQILQQGEPSFAIHFGTLGIFRMSGSLVIQLQNILTNPNLNWRYEALYVPFILPFVIVSALTMLIFRKGLSAHPREVLRAVAKRLVDPAIAVFGALVLVQLMIRSGEQSPAFIIGSNLSRWFQEGFVVISPLLGCLGTFFSGTGVVSNLTFGQVQATAAESIGIAPSILLALQVVGGSAGNGVSLASIIAANAVVGLTVGESQVLVQTARFVFTVTTVSTVVMLILFIRF